MFNNFDEETNISLRVLLHASKFKEFYLISFSDIYILLDEQIVQFISRFKLVFLYFKYVF